MSNKKKNTNTSTQQSNSSHWNTLQSYASIIVFVFSFVLYFNSVFNDYNMDDELVTQNHKLTSKGVGAIPEIFQSPYYSDEAGYKYEYRPLVLATFAIEHSIWGDNAFMSHLVNVLLYALSCVVLLKLLKLLLKNYNQLLPFLITLVFAAHPIHTEVVDSIKNRDEILVLVFGLLTTMYTILYAQSNSLYHVILIPIWMLLAMLSKPSAAVFAFIAPFTAVMLSNIKYKQAIAIVLLLYIPAILLARLYYLKHQILIFLALLIAISLFYALRNSQQFMTFIKKLKDALISNYNIKQLNNEYSDEKKLQFNYLSLALFSALFLIIGLTAAIGIYTSNIIVTLSAFATLIVGYILLSEHHKIILLPIITLLCSFYVVKYHLRASVADAALLLLIHGYLMSKNKPLRILAFISLITYAAITALLMHSYFALAIVVFAGFWNNRLKAAQLILPLIAALWAARNFYPYMVGSKTNLAWLSFLLLAAGAIAWRTKKITVYNKIVPIVLFAGIVFISFTNKNQITQTKQPLPIKEQLVKVNFAKSIDLTPVDAKRPLKFIEIPVNETDKLSIRLGTAADVLLKYLQREIIAYPMSYYYGYAYIKPTEITNLWALISVAFYVALLILSFMLVNRWPLLSYSIIVYLSAIAVYCTLVVPIPGMMGDRFLLIPSIGFSIALVVLLSKFIPNAFEKNDRMNSTFRYTLIGLLVTYSGMTFARNFSWKDHLTLFRNDIKVVENSAQAQNLLALHLYLEAAKTNDVFKQKELREEAIPHFKRALEIYPKYMNASFDLGRCYEALGNIDEAYKAFENTIKIDSSFVAPCFSMALIQHNKGNTEAAIPLYEKFLTKYPYQKEVYANLSFAYFSLKQYDKSIQVNKKALFAFPNAFEPTVNIAKTFLTINQRDSALYYFRKAEAINPADANIKGVIQQLTTH